MVVRRVRKIEKTQLSPIEVLAVSGPKVKKASKPAKAPAVNLDYPKEGEALNPGSYAIRVSAACDHKVEISIDGGPWAECRHSVGYFWYDWAPSGSGEHRIVARAKKGGPRVKTSQERRCVVV